MLSGVQTAADIDQSLEAFDRAIKAMLQEGLIRADEGVMGCCDGREGPRCGEECRQGIIHHKALSINGSGIAKTLSAPRPVRGCGVCHG
jgi:hypothetical protein